MDKTLLTNGLLLLPDGRFTPGSLLVEGETITRVFPDGEVLPEVFTVDLAGRTLIPGFIDAHVHLSALALKRLRCDLAIAQSAQEIIERLKAAGPPDGMFGSDGMPPGPLYGAGGATRHPLPEQQLTLARNPGRFERAVNSVSATTPGGENGSDVCNCTPLPVDVTYWDHTECIPWSLR